MQIKILFIAILGWSTAFAVENITGTTWVVKDNDGYVTTLTFESKNECTYYFVTTDAGNEGIRYRNCKWTQNKNVVVFEFNNHFAVYSGVLAQDSLAGSWVSNRGPRKGTFQATKVR